MDNLQNSLQFVKVLVMLGMRTNGTLRTNFGPRGIWGGVTVNAQNPIAAFRADFAFTRRGQPVSIPLYALALCGTAGKTFHMLTSADRYHFVQRIEGGDADPNLAGRRAAVIFDVNDEYNHCKSGVDINDQYAYYWEIKMRSKKWTRSVFVALLNRALVQASLLMQRWRNQQLDAGIAESTTKMNRAAFVRHCFAGGPSASAALLQRLQEVCNDHGVQPPARVRLAIRVASVPASPRTPTVATPIASAKVQIGALDVRKVGRHYPAMDPWYDQERQNPRNCVHCKAHRTVYFCKSCQIPLCAVPCFEEFHESE